ncbi:hypothetical protein [Streptosporangium sp. G12]
MMTMLPRASAPVPVQQAEAEEAEDFRPQLITPSQNVRDWPWANQVRPPYIDGTVQEKWSKVVVPVRVLALFTLWITWHVARCAALLVVLVLLLVLVLVR